MTSEDMKSCLYLLEKIDDRLKIKSETIKEAIKKLSSLKDDPDAQFDVIVCSINTRIDKIIHIKALVYTLKIPLYISFDNLKKITRILCPNKINEITTSTHKIFKNLYACALFLMLEILEDQNGSQRHGELPTRNPQALQKGYLELRMLVESTHITQLESLKDTPNQALTREQIDAIFTRPNIYKIHRRSGPQSIGDIFFSYPDGEALFGRPAQLYLCVNIEHTSDEPTYTQIFHTKSLSVLKRRLESASFTLRELRYEKLDDTNLVQTGK